MQVQKMITPAAASPLYDLDFLPVKRMLETAYKDCLVKTRVLKWCIAIPCSQLTNASAPFSGTALDRDFR